MDPPPQSIDDKDVTVETRGVYPSHFLLKIESFAPLSRIGVHKFVSDEFDAGGYKWRLIIYPNGEITGDNNDVHVSAYLGLANSNSLPPMWEVNTVFGIFLHNRKSDNFFCKRGKTQRFHAMSPAWGFSKFISRKTLADPSNGYMTNDDSCAFGAEVFVIKGQGSVQRLSKNMAATYFKHSWRIESFSELEDEWKSEVFQVGGQNWLMKLFPGGSNTGKGSHVSVYLELVELRHPCEGVEAELKIQINDRVRGEHLVKSVGPHWFKKSCDDWGLSKMVSITDVNDPANGYIYGDCCVIEIEVSVLDLKYSSILAK